jgi:uncharacterized membrane protein
MLIITMALPKSVIYLSISLLFIFITVWGTAALLHTFPLEFNEWRWWYFPLVITIGIVDGILLVLANFLAKEVTKS